MKDELVKYRLEVINSAKRIGISKSADLYEVNRSTIRRWIQRYEADGESGLTNRSKKGKFQFWNQIPKEVEKRIIKLKQSEPDISMGEIKRRLDLSHSRSTIFNKLKDCGLVGDIRKDLSSELLETESIPFTHFYLTVKRISECSNDLDSFRYQYILTEKETRVQFLSYSTYFDEINYSIFLEYFLTQVTDLGINSRNITIYMKRFKRKQLEIFNKRFSSRFEAKIIFKDRLAAGYSESPINSKIVEKLIKFDKSDFIILSYAKMILENSLIFSRLRSKTEQRIQSIHNYKDIINKLIYRIHPLDLDTHFKISEILEDCNYWDRLDSERIYKKANIELLAAGGSFGKRFENSKAIELYDTIINATKYTGDLRLKISSMIYKGTTLQKIGKWEETLNLYLEGLKEAKKHRFYDLQVKLLTQIGVQHFFQSRYSDSAEYLEKSLKMSREYNLAKDEITILLNLGALYLKMGEYNKAIRRNNKLFSILDDKDPRIVTLYANSGVIYEHKGKIERSMDYYLKGLELGKISGAKRQVSQILNNLGNLYLKLYEDSKSYNSYKQLLDHAIKQGNRSWIGVAYNNIGKYYFTVGDYRESLTSYQQSLIISVELNDPTSQGIAYLNMAEVYYQLESYSTAIDELDKAIDIFERNGDQTYIPLGHLLKGMVSIKLKNYFLANRSFDLSIKGSKKLGIKEQILGGKILFNINKCLRILSGYKRYSISFEELIVEVYEQLESYKVIEVDDENYGKTIDLFYRLLIDKRCSDIRLDYSISLEMMRSMVKNQLVSHYRSLFERSGRVRYLAIVESYG